MTSDQDPIVRFLFKIPYPYSSSRLLNVFPYQDFKSKDLSFFTNKEVKRAETSPSERIPCLVISCGLSWRVLIKFVSREEWMGDISWRAEHPSHRSFPGSHNLFFSIFYSVLSLINIQAGSAISNGREPRSCLGRVFNIKLGSFVSKQLNCMARTHTATSRVENSAQVSSC